MGTSTGRLAELDRSDLLGLVTDTHLYSAFAEWNRNAVNNGDDKLQLGEFCTKIVGCKRLDSPSRLAEHLERRELSPPGVITSYIPKNDATGNSRYRASIGRAWVRPLVKAHRGSWNSLAALLVGEGLIGFQTVEPLGRDVSRRTVTKRLTEMTDSDFEEVTAKLVSLGSSGHPAALRQLAVLSIYEFSTIRDAVFNGLNTADIRLARSIERAMRFGLLSRRSRKAVVRECQTPFASQPDSDSAVLLRPTTWLRLLRRCAIDQIDWLTESDSRTLQKWPFEQLEIALRGERAYRWISPLEKRYAYWVARELIHRLPAQATERARFASDFRRIAEQDPDIADLANIPVQNAPESDWADWRPEDGWPAPTIVIKKLGDLTLSSTYAIQKRKVSIAVDVAQLMAEAVCTPCAIRYGRAADALAALPRDVRASVISTLRECQRQLRTNLEKGSESVAPYLERTLLLMGHVGLNDHAQGCLREIASDETSPDWLRRAAIWELGTLRAEDKTDASVDVVKNLQSAPGIVGMTAAAAFSSMNTTWPDTGYNLHPFD